MSDRNTFLVSLRNSLCRDCFLSLPSLELAEPSSGPLPSIQKSVTRLYPFHRRRDGQPGEVPYDQINPRAVLRHASFFWVAVRRRQVRRTGSSPGGLLLIIPVGSPFSLITSSDLFPLIFVSFGQKGVLPEIKFSCMWGQLTFG